LAHQFLPQHHAVGFGLTHKARFSYSPSPKRDFLSLKVVLRESSENEALQAIVAIQKGKVLDLTTSLAVAASKLSLKHDLPLADSIILASARKFDATLWTQDSDFMHIGGVKYFPKKK